MDIIKEFGQRLSGIVLLLNDFFGYFGYNPQAPDFIISPELETLTLGTYSLEDMNGASNLFIEDDKLVDLSKRCKKLKDLKIIKAYIPISCHSGDQDDFIEENFPNCNVEFDECKFMCEDCSVWDFTDCDHNCPYD